MFHFMKRLLPLFILACLLKPVLADDESNFSFTDSGQENKWVAPPPVDESDRMVKFDLQAAFQQDADLQGQAFSMLDLSAKRTLDENSVFAEGLLRFRKSLSTSDTVDTIDLRLARISYLEPWLQVTGGRFDLFQM